MKNILIVYAAKISNGNMEQEVVTLDGSKIKILKMIFQK